MLLVYLIGKEVTYPISDDDTIESMGDKTGLQFTYTNRTDIAIPL